MSCSATGSAIPWPSSYRRRPTGSSGRPTPRLAPRKASGSATASAPFSASPQPHAATPWPTSATISDEAGERAEREAERGRPVVVERRERARGDARVDLRDRRRHEPRQELGSRMAGARVDGQQPRDAVRPGEGDDQQRHRRERERDEPGPHLAREPSVGTGPDEARQDDDPQRSRPARARGRPRRRRRSRRSLRRAQTCAREWRPATAADPLTAAVESPVRRPLPTALRRLRRLPCIDAARRYCHLD